MLLQGNTDLVTGLQGIGDVASLESSSSHLQLSISSFGRIDLLEGGKDLVDGAIASPYDAVDGAIEGHLFLSMALDIGSFSKLKAVMVVVSDSSLVAVGGSNCPVVWYSCTESLVFVSKFRVDLGF